MGLSCECNFAEDVAWYYSVPQDVDNSYSMFEKKRGARCCSCNELIRRGDTCVEFERTRYPKDEIEERIYGDGEDAVPMSSVHMCEPCGDLFWSLYELGYCLDIKTDMRELVREYNEIK